MWRDSVATLAARASAAPRLAPSLSRHAGWRDQTGYALQIKTNTG